MQFDYHILSAIALGIALSACCGFRIFIPMLAGSVAAFNHWMAVPADMQWMGSWPAIICFATAAVVEVGAYYFPFLDNILDAIAAPLAIAAGTVLAFAFLPGADNEPLLRWVTALLAGGATAGTIHAGTGLLRLFSTKATLGTGNPVIATGENAAAIAGSVASFFIPVVIALILLLVVGWIIVTTLRRFVNKKPIV
ncbi:MAG TPA: DUF4126 domain-containing protein [Chitinophagaceae bacterium]|jgi:hypothetical protein|nr:DUF4126 domain-containing protein [Chitinophagaceae bacterium]